LLLVAHRIDAIKTPIITGTTKKGELMKCMVGKLLAGPRITNRAVGLQLSGLGFHFSDRVAVRLPIGGLADT
jgi:hypothetical protein